MGLSLVQQPDALPVSAMAGGALAGNLGGRAEVAIGEGCDPVIKLGVGPGFMRMRRALMLGSSVDEGSKRWSAACCGLTEAIIG